MGGDLDLVADLRGLLARDVPLAFGFALPGMRTGPGGAFIMMAAPPKRFMISSLIRASPEFVTLAGRGPSVN
jgi:hypothetical protein